MGPLRELVLQPRYQDKQDPEKERPYLRGGSLEVAQLQKVLGLVGQSK